MSDEWVWQGFFGPMAIALAEKAKTDVLPAEVAGAKVPPPDAPPVAVDLDGTEGMFAIQTRPNAPYAVPSGMKAARPELVGRLVGG